MSLQTSRLPIVLWSIALIAVIAAITTGLISTGGPVQQRKERLDNQRARDLGDIYNQVETYFRNQQKLPQTLAELNADPEILKDPDNGQPYEYYKINGQSFVLCARFETDSRHRKRRSRYYDDAGPYREHSNRHPAGHHCFTLRQTPKASDKPEDAPRFRWN